MVPESARMMVFPEICTGKVPVMVPPDAVTSPDAVISISILFPPPAVELIVFNSTYAHTWLVPTLIDPEIVMSSEALNNAVLPKSVSPPLYAQLDAVS